MTMQRNGFKKNLDIRLDENPPINGLDNFKRNLEKDFYSKAQVRSCSCTEGGGNLVISVECPLVLGELLFHLEKGNWGNEVSKENIGRNGSSLAHRISELRMENEIAIEIEELNFQLKDSTLVIKRIFPQSIEKELHQILEALVKHYIHFTKGLNKAVYEIFIPVFEEEFTKKLPKADTDPEILRQTYLRYWGLYFDSEEDAVIYDLSRRSFISGDLHMLNH
ncbi:MAG: hypothetical protein KJO20_03680 [Eudoraea sp.]|nr:hypothetical protein [Eudoraea sp.]NNK29997.1 hypothetical protein [Flavobacteriaceae bacterium]